jgi:peptidyl-Asp metalloendopeptidase
VRFRIVIMAGLLATLAASPCAAEAPLLALPAASLPESTLAATAKAGVDARRILPNIPLFHTVADKAAAFGDNAGARAYPNPLRLELAPGVAFDGQVYRVERSDNGAISLSMKLAGQPLGYAVLTELDGHVHGMVMMPGGRWQVKSLDDGSPIVEKLDDAAFPPDGQPHAVHGARPHAGAAGDGPLASAGSTNQWRIDVMIVWDAAAQAAAGGGAAGMQTMAANAVAIANTTYANSGIAQRVRLVYSGAVTYTERTTCSGGGDAFDCALDDITNDLITAPATLSSLRATHGADLVTLLIGDESFCGIAWLPDTISSANSGLGFSVVSQSCAVGNLSYPHELGHNMGANHDAANAGI